MDKCAAHCLEQACGYELGGMPDKADLALRLAIAKDNTENRVDSSAASLPRHKNPSVPVIASAA